MNSLSVHILCASIVCTLMVCSSVAKTVHVEYERSGTCDVSNIMLYAHLICKGSMAGYL